jgi:predicted MFS family arabinose efflux permease
MTIHSTLPKTFLPLLAFAVGVMAANVYYSQPILALIADSLGIRPDAAGLIMTLTQVGYGFGVLLIVPLGDLFENRKLILIMITVTIFAELTLGFSHAVLPYSLASVAAGLGAATVQILIPYATHLYPREMRGRVLGTLMSGLMLGIMLSRPLASLLTDMVDLHAVFYVSAVIMALLVVRLFFILPSRTPGKAGLDYGRLIVSMAKLVKTTPILRRRGINQGLMFGAFCLFWTTMPLMLVNSAFHFTQKGVALFALAGVAGAVVAPFAGRAADKGHGRAASILAFCVGVMAFALAHFLPEGGWLTLALLVVAANLLDAGVASHLVLGQRAIFMIDPANQSRLNGLYIAIVYVGGSIGSALGAWAYLHGGWAFATMIGLLFPLLALSLILSEKFFGYSEAA